MTESDAYHALAKDAGNRLKSYILGYASGATGVFFLSLADTKEIFTSWQKTYLILALLFFVTTTVICLYELHIDARRFFYVAKQLEQPNEKRSWVLNNFYKIRRVRLIYTSYITVAFATFFAVLFLIARVA
jgi:hypothetical protein